MEVFLSILKEEEGWRRFHTDKRSAERMAHESNVDVNRNLGPMAVPLSVRQQ
jgi:hypothetical protein